MATTTATPSPPTLNDKDDINTRNHHNTTTAKQQCKLIE
jgi:hypothetical protein